MTSSSSDTEPVPSPFTEFAEYQAFLQKTIISAAKHATSLPPKTDLAFQRTLDRQFAKDLDACSARILGFTNRLLNLVGDAVPSSSRGKGKAKEVTEEEDLTEGYHSRVVDVLDGLYENVVSRKVIFGPYS